MYKLDGGGGWGGQQLFSNYLFWVMLVLKTHHEAFGKLFVYNLGRTSICVQSAPVDKRVIFFSPPPPLSSRKINISHIISRIN